MIRSYHTGIAKTTPFIERNGVFPVIIWNFALDTFFSTYLMNIDEELVLDQRDTWVRIQGAERLISSFIS